MVVIDTSAWLHHIRHGDPVVMAGLVARLAVGHVDVAGEIRVGSGLPARRLSDQVLRLPRLEALDPLATLSKLDEQQLAGCGIGWTDAAIFLACASSAEVIALYTRDRRMAAAAERIGVTVFQPPPN
jgi:hypothetical protein